MCPKGNIWPFIGQETLLESKLDQMKPTYLYLLLAILLCACNPVKELTQTPTYNPSLGIIGKEDNTLLQKNFRQLGQPNLTGEITLSVSEIQFTKSKFKAYQSLMVQNGQRTAFSYVDSLPVQPKFLRFEIQDKIELITILNSVENTEARTYLERDPDSKIVSSISTYMDEREADQFTNSAQVFLTTEVNGMLQIMTLNGKEKRFYFLRENQIFSYDLMGLCWGRDVYGRAKIEAFNMGGKCPKGTDKKPLKDENLKSYLKL